MTKPPKGSSWGIDEGEQDSAYNHQSHADQECPSDTLSVFGRSTCGFRPLRADGTNSDRTSATAQAGRSEPGSDMAPRTCSPSMLIRRGSTL